MLQSQLNENTPRLLTSQINEWIDQNPDIAVKFSDTTVGDVEGKTGSFKHLIITIWY